MILEWIDYISQFFTIANPFLFFISTCLWVNTYFYVTKKMKQNDMRQYCIEKQIDYLVMNLRCDNHYIETLRSVHYMYDIEKKTNAKTKIV